MYESSKCRPVPSLSFGSQEASPGGLALGKRYDRERVVRLGQFLHCGMSQDHLQVKLCHPDGPRNRPITRPAPAQTTVSYQDRTGYVPRFIAASPLFRATSSPCQHARCAELGHVKHRLASTKFLRNRTNSEAKSRRSSLPRLHGPNRRPTTEYAWHFLNPTPVSAHQPQDRDSLQHYGWCPGGRTQPASLIVTWFATRRTPGIARAWPTTRDNSSSSRANPIMCTTPFSVPMS